MKVIERLKNDIDSFQQEFPIMSDHRFGVCSVNNHKIVKRIREGGDLRTDTIDRIYTYMNEYRSENVVNTS